MTIQTIELQNIQMPLANPRKAFDDTKLDELANSIRQDGQMQNLVVQPVEGKEGKFRVISGERRLRAFRKLAEQGDIAADYPVQVQIRVDLEKDEVLRLATVENVQRENLTALEEAAAFAKLVKMGDTLDDVAAQTGLSKRTIKQRIALNGLCKEAKQALRDKKITLSQAQALTIGTADRQLDVLEDLQRGYRNYDADDIRDSLIGESASVSMAIFPVEQYKGRLASDLFGEAETTYFEDFEQFYELQQKAVRNQADHYYRNTPAKWVDVTNDYSLRHWQYEEAEKGEPYGVLINLSPSGEVEIKEGLVKPDIDEDTAEETAVKPDTKEQKAKPPYSAVMQKYITWHKTVAVQEMLLAHPRTVKELTVLDALSSLRPHKALSALDDLPDQQIAFGVIEEQAQRICKILNIEIDAEGRAYEALAYDMHDDEDLYAILQDLTDKELDEIQGFATIISFGQHCHDKADTDENSLFNLVANDVQTGIRNHWTPDITFLQGRTQKQLVQIAKESGYIGYVGGYKKSELVNTLLRHFDSSRAADQPTESQKKANAWYPAVMNFPASKETTG